MSHHRNAADGRRVACAPPPHPRPHQTATAPSTETPKPRRRRPPPPPRTHRGATPTLSPPHRASVTRPPGRAVVQPRARKQLHAKRTVAPNEQVATQSCCRYDTSATEDGRSVGFLAWSKGWQGRRASASGGTSAAPPSTIEGGRTETREGVTTGDQRRVRHGRPCQMGGPMPAPQRSHPRPRLLHCSGVPNGPMPPPARKLAAGP